LLDQEKAKKAEIQIITRSKKKNTLVFSFDNGEMYELYNYVDPLKDKPKPKDYKPPEMQTNKIDKIEEEPDSSPFTIAHFVLWTLFLGLAFLSAMLAWLIYNFKFEYY
jgi:hypothetical protein